MSIKLLQRLKDEKFSCSGDENNARICLSGKFRGHFTTVGDLHPYLTR